jgi:hypothetical protein
VIQDGGVQWMTAGERQPRAAAARISEALHLTVLRGASQPQCPSTALRLAVFGLVRSFGPLAPALCASNLPINVCPPSQVQGEASSTLRCLW